MKSPRLSLRRVSAEEKPSTAFSHEAEVGVRWNTQRGWRESQASTLGQAGKAGRAGRARVDGVASGAMDWLGSDARR